MQNSFLLSIYRPIRLSIGKPSQPLTQSLSLFLSINSHQFAPLSIPYSVIFVTIHPSSLSIQHDVRFHSAQKCDKHFQKVEKCIYKATRLVNLINRQRGEHFPCPYQDTPMTGKQEQNKKKKKKISSNIKNVFSFSFHFLAAKVNLFL